MIKIILTTILTLSSLSSQEVIWQESSSQNALSSTEVDKAIKEYVDKTYPNKVKEYEKTLPKDKYGVVYGFVISPYTGKVWLDRNLGARRVCTSFDDSSCYGDYFQWGRDSDGHEKSSSSSTSSQSTNPKSVGHSKFITSSGSYDYDWAKDADSSGSLRAKNWNPCPSGYRVPTIDELKAETLDVGVKNRSDAFNSFLKLPSAGYRDDVDASMSSQGSYGGIWSSSVGGAYSEGLNFNSSDAGWDYNTRAYGQSVRCLRD